MSYCSALCLGADWKHHKSSCRLAQLKAAVKDLTKREIKWIKNLPREVKGKLEGIDFDDEDEDEELFEYTHHLYFAQFALVLAGVNACHYHDVPERRSWNEYIKQFYVRVLSPWYTKHRAFLKKREGL